LDILSLNQLLSERGKSRKNRNEKIPIWPQDLKKKKKQQKGKEREFGNTCKRDWRKKR